MFSRLLCICLLLNLSFLKGQDFTCVQEREKLTKELSIYEKEYEERCNKAPQNIEYRKAYEEIKKALQKLEDLKKRASSLKKTKYNEEFRNFRIEFGKIREDCNRLLTELTDGRGLINIQFSIKIVRVILIGTTKYQDPELQLNSCAFNNDLELFREAVTNRIFGNGIVPEISLLIDKRKDEIEKFLENLQVMEESLIVIYLTSHGRESDNRLNDSHYYFVCCNTPQQKINKDTAIPLAYFNELIKKKIPKTKKAQGILLVDVCHSNPDKSRENRLSINKEIHNTVPGWVIITSNNRDQDISYIGAFNNQKLHGYFTYILCEALKNFRVLDENRDTKIDVQELFEYIREKVRQLSKHKLEIQIPGVKYGNYLQKEFIIGYSND